MQKILIIGLDGAGKTALYQKFFLKKIPEQLQKIPPTKGIAKYSHDFLRTDVLILDTGGAKELRQDYLGNIELVSDLSAVIFIVDVQDVKKYQEVANFLLLWTKSASTYLKGVKGYLIFNKIDPGMEGQLKAGLEQIARLLAPLDQIFPGQLFKTITSIYSDSSSEIFQKILLDLMPRKTTKALDEKPQIKIPSTTKQVPTKEIVEPPVVKESYMTKPIKVEAEAEQQFFKTVKPPGMDTKVTPLKPFDNTSKISPPVINSSASTQTPPAKSTSPITDIATQVKPVDIQQMKEKLAERLTDIIAVTLDNNRNFVAIAIFSKQVELVVGAVQHGGNQAILRMIEATLKKINLEEYMNSLGKLQLGGEGHIKIEEFDIFFERVSPDHLSTVICSSLEEETINNISQLNRYLNQALSVTPEGADSSIYRRSDLINELKMRLYNIGKSVDHVG